MTPHFFLEFPDLPENISDEILHVDVWNFMPDENLREKLKKINEVRDSKGLRQFIMDTWSGNGNGNNNKLIGSLEVPLCQVPASGLNKWWQIEKAEKVSQIFFFLFRLISKSMISFTGK